MSWSHATMLVLLACMAIGAAVAFRPKRRNRRVRPAAPLQTVDYSAQYRKMVDWLGDDFLLAKPINRPRTNTLPEMLRR